MHLRRFCFYNEKNVTNGNICFTVVIVLKIFTLHTCLFLCTLQRQIKPNCLTITEDESEV